MNRRPAARSCLPAIVLFAALLLAAGCHTESPPEVVCPTEVGDPVSICRLNRSPVIVEAKIIQWSSDATRVMSLAGFPDTVMTPAEIQILQSLRGDESGHLNVLFRGCVGADGEALDGPLRSGDEPSIGFLFIVAADDYAVVARQGFFRRDGDLLFNSGVASKGVTEADFLQQLSAAEADEACSPL